MPRRLRESSGGICYHVLNRAVGRATIFEKENDYAAFLRCVDHAFERLPTMRVLGLVLIPNHWHLVLWPEADGELSEFMRLMTVTHTQRWHANRHTAGTGPLYQGRFSSFAAMRLTNTDRTIGLRRLHHSELCHYLRCDASRDVLLMIREAVEETSMLLEDGDEQVERELEMFEPYRHRVYAAVTSTALLAAEREGLRREREVWRLRSIAFIRQVAEVR